MAEKDLIVNGNFSNGNTGFTSDCTYSSSGISSATYFVGTDPHAWNFNMSPCMARSGNGNMLMVNGAQQLNTKIWSETVVVQPNTNYVFTGWLGSLTSISPARLQLYINGQPVGPLIQADTNTCSWRQFFNVWNSGANTSAQVSIIDMNLDISGNDFGLDDISFSAYTMLTDSVMITVRTNPAPQVTADKAHDIDCSQPTTELNATGAATYSWVPSVGLSDPESTNPVVSIDTTTTYTVKGTDSWGCSSYGRVTVNVRAVGKDLFILPNSFTPNGDDITITLV